MRPAPSRGSVDTSTSTRRARAARLAQRVSAGNGDLDRPLAPPQDGRGPRRATGAAQGSGGHVGAPPQATLHPGANQFSGTAYRVDRHEARRNVAHGQVGGLQPPAGLDLAGGHDDRDRGAGAALDLGHPAADLGCRQAAAGQGQSEQEDRPAAAHGRAHSAIGSSTAAVVPSGVRVTVSRPPASSAARAAMRRPRPRSG